MSKRSRRATFCGIGNLKPAFRELFRGVTSNKKFAFTLAEVLITLGVIGVVAALTMPTLLKNIAERSNSEAQANLALNGLDESRWWSRKNI